MLPPKLRLALCVYSLLMFSVVVNLVQIVCWPLHWVGLRSLWVRITRLFANCGYLTFVFWLEYSAGIKVVITGDELPPGEKALVLCNHVRVEWLHLICLTHRYTSASGFKTVMKDALKYVPIACAAVMDGHITVKRALSKKGRDATLASMTTQIRKLCRDQVPLWLILFPEGTWIEADDEGQKTKESSNGFARKQGYPALHNVLFPKTAGFCALLEGMRQEPEHCAVYDVTVAYNKPYHPVKIGTASPPSVVLLCKGVDAGAPREIHFHVRRFPLPNGIPAGEEAAGKWLQHTFAVEKEGLLEAFERSDPHRFPGPDRSSPLNVPKIAMHVGFLTLSTLVLLWAIYTLLGRWPLIAFIMLGGGAAMMAATGDEDAPTIPPPSKQKQ